MTDRELLERAAKAAGYKVAWEGASETGWMSGATWWNPLIDDGDALRLAVRLELLVNIDQYRAKASDGVFVECVELRGVDPCAATRRAIVRAAAEMTARP